MNRRIFNVIFATLFCSSAAMADSDIVTTAARTRDEMMKVDIDQFFQPGGLQKLVANFRLQLPAGWTLLTEEDWLKIVGPYLTGWVLDEAGAPRLSYFFYLGERTIGLPSSPSLSVSVLEPERSEKLLKEFEKLTSDSGQLGQGKMEILRKEQKNVTQKARDAGCAVAERDEKGSLICLAEENHRVIVVEKIDECHTITPLRQSQTHVSYITGLHCSR